jgi:hypothetical protein
LVNGGGTGGENGTSALRKADTDILSKHARHTSKAVGLAPPNLSQALQMALHDYWHYLTWSVRSICVELQQNESYVQHFISRKYWHGNIQWFIFVSTNDTIMTFLSTGNAFLSFIIFTSFYIFRTTT